MTAVISSFALLAAAAIALATPALAGGPAPASVEPEPAAAAPAKADTWTGPWVGLSLGSGFANYDFGTRISNPSDPGEFVSLNLPDYGGDGAFAAIELGYGRRFADNMVWGVQFDHAVSGIDTGSEFATSVPFAIETHFKPATLTTLGARFGYLVNDRTLIFGMGGATRAEFEGSASISGAATSENDFSIETWGVTLGVGAETQIAKDLSLKFDYRITDFGDYSIYDESIDAANFDGWLATKVQTFRVTLARKF
ncbi:outer membrane protein [Tabrizicola soli]|uniref:Outer membrane protein n=1 Tax=Tabrizicola soli TaxID=2185115 RepID=A0ABV7DWH5_9RHOB|nr:outer membrane beta-barrel protein [Tabrizicola soli]